MRKDTPLKGSPAGRVVVDDREHTDRHSFTGKHPTLGFDTSDEQTVCYCGVPFSQHTQSELDYLKEHKTCSRVARKA